MEQFKRDAVAMLETSPDASMRKVADEPGSIVQPWDIGTSSLVPTLPLTMQARLVTGS